MARGAQFAPVISSKGRVYAGGTAIAQMPLSLRRICPIPMPTGKRYNITNSSPLRFNLIMVDKNYCMSSFLGFRYVEDASKQFFSNMPCCHYKRIPEEEKILVGTAEEIDIALRNAFHSIANEKIGLFLSGGMDSAILAPYMPKGSDAYTFRFMGGKYLSDEIHRAEVFAEYNKLQLHYIDIDWSTVELSIEAVMENKGAPVHSIEPQLYYAAKKMLDDGITMAVVGDGSDYVFGGMDGLLSKDWKYQEYIDRVIYVKPEEVLISPSNIYNTFERYRLGRNSVDFLRFYNDIITDESYGSYENAFAAANIDYIDPYENLKLSKPLDLERIRMGESKYLIRELFKLKYPDLPVPQKLPMPRPVDEYFKNWNGPIRPEFRKDVDYTKFSGNQKWLIWCLEKFLNTFER